MNRPIASVIIPTFNEEKIIGATLRALSDQTIPRSQYEIIVADGYSEDKTIAVSRRLADKVVFEKKLVIAAGRQKGALAAKGKILVCADGDSRSRRDWLEELLKPFADKRVAASFGAVEPLESTPFRELMCRLMSVYFRITAALGLPSGAGASLAIRADAFTKAGGFDTGLVTGEDVELQKRVKRLGRVVFAPRSVMAISFRRVEKWGYLKFILFHSANFLRTHFLGRSAEQYERIR